MYLNSSLFYDVMAGKERMPRHPFLSRRTHTRGTTLYSIALGAIIALSMISLDRWLFINASQPSLHRRLKLEAIGLLSAAVIILALALVNPDGRSQHLDLISLLLTSAFLVIAAVNSWRTGRRHRTLAPLKHRAWFCGCLAMPCVLYLLVLFIH